MPGLRKIDRKAGLRHRLLAMALPVLLLAPTAVDAQYVIMRKVIPTKAQTHDAGTPTPTPAGSTTPGAGGTPAPGQPGYYNWYVTDWTQSGACGQVGTETRSVACHTPDGTTVADALCTGNGSGERPVASQQIVVTSTCGYKWQTGDWSSPDTTCGTSAITRDVTCIRSDETVATPDLCPKPMPDSVMNVSQYQGCAYVWSTTDWSASTTSCGDAVQTRSVACHRQDGTTADDASCSGSGDRPSASRTVHETSGCANHWVSGDWSAPAPACGDTTQARTVVCQRGDGVTVADDQCAGDKPATTQPATDRSTCTYGWTPGDWSAPATTCGDASETRTVSCLDSGGKPAADALCTGTKPDAARTEHVITGCSYDWQTGDFGPVQPACGATAQTRAVTCRRGDGETVADPYCTTATRPSATQPATDYSTCSFGWVAGDWSALTTTCGDATQTRTVSCQRSDGAAATDDQCQASSKPPVTQTTHQTTSCSFSWKPGDWGASTPACGDSSHSRTVVCLRSDGTTVDDAQCSGAGAKPDLTQPSTDYSTCTYKWATGDYGAPSATCGTATQTRSVTCQRSDGTGVGDGFCTGTKPDGTLTTTQTSGCTYSWVPGAYGTPAPACGATTQTRPVTCTRSDNTPASSDSLCTGTKPGTTQAATDYSTCTYSWNATAWKGSSSTCNSSATQTRTVTCQRSDTTPVADSYCASAGTKPPASQTITDYSSCTYTGSYTYGACSGGQKTGPISTCTRQDGTVVANSYCPSTSTVSCSKCTPLVNNSGPGGYATSTRIGTTSDLATAQSTCENYAQAHGAGICEFNQLTSTNEGWPATSVTFVTGGTNYTGQNSGMYSSICSK